MRLSLKNTKQVHINPSTQAPGLDLSIEGVDAEAILAHIDIVTAIEYYGITELLDTIGEEHLKSYKKCL